MADRDKRELARVEGLSIWLAAVCHALGIVRKDDVRLRDAEVAFDIWWSKQSRRALKRRLSR